MIAQVGIDVPEATVMVVEAAERFGLAALHQLRGRVGRGARASRCYLVTTQPYALKRLKIMELSQDGFHIAQADLMHRCGCIAKLGREPRGPPYATPTSSYSSQFGHPILLRRAQRTQGRRFSRRSVTPSQTLL